jgi:hypothetical protein
MVTLETLSYSLQVVQSNFGLLTILISISSIYSNPSETYSSISTLLALSELKCIFPTRVSILK